MRYSLVSDLRDALNDPDPEGRLVELLDRPHFPQSQQQKLKQLFDLALKKAADEHITLGVDLGTCLSLEDAYLLRNRFIARFCGRLESRQLLSRMVTLALAGLIIFSFVLIF